VSVPYAILGNPQTLNLYSYVGGDPTNHADPDGHMNLNALSTENTENWLGDYLDGSGSGEAESKTEEKAQDKGQGQSGQSEDDKRASWDKSKPTPPDPSKLGPDWKLNPKHKDPNGGEEYINQKTGEKIEWNKGRPGSWGPKADRAKDGWHHTPPGGVRGKQIDPGQMIKTVGITAIVGLAIHYIIETAPEWVPWAARVAPVVF
jgi:hypothetical protein